MGLFFLGEVAWTVPTDQPPPRPKQSFSIRYSAMMEGKAATIRDVSQTQNPKTWRRKLGRRRWMPNTSTRKASSDFCWLLFSLLVFYTASALVRPPSGISTGGGAHDRSRYEKRPTLFRPSSRFYAVLAPERERTYHPTTQRFVALKSDQDYLVQDERKSLGSQNSDVMWDRSNSSWQQRNINAVQQITQRRTASPFYFANQSIVAQIPPLSFYANETVLNDLDSIQTETTNNGKSRISMLHRAIWKRRNARSAEEGIRREKLPQLSSLLENAKALDIQSPRYAARTIAGLVSALAEEVDDLDVEVVARPDTPFWDKQVDEVKIKFSRIGFKPLKMGGLRQAMKEFDEHCDDDNVSNRLRQLSNADEAFDEIDVDNSGYLDGQEIGEALLLASGPTDPGEGQIIQKLASDLIKLYDINGDGVISRSEYQLMVEDMAALEEKQTSEAPSLEKAEEGGIFAQPLSAVKQFFGSLFARFNTGEVRSDSSHAPVAGIGNNTIASSAVEIINSTESVEMLVDSVAKEFGCITISDLKLDLRRLVFGGVPVIKHITPGGPLILEPFTVTVNGSFTRDDIMTSPILEDGLSRLIALVLRRRVRSIRDMADLAVFFGRDYKLTSENAPVTEVLELRNVEFDDQDRLIMTGRARVRTSPLAPTIEQAFKVRAKLGTRKNGRFIRLVEPELAFFWECPPKVQESIAMLFRNLGMEPPSRPEVFFFPIYSPFKPDDNDGFDMGEYNAFHNIYVHKGALRFELSAVLRPGRFLGNHYIAFTLPIRTFIITLDRVREGIRAARKDKRRKKEQERLLQKEKQQQMQGLLLSQQRQQQTTKTVDSERKKKQLAKKKRPPRKSFFSRFVDGYMQAEREEPDRTRIASVVRDFFSRQLSNGNTTRFGSRL